MMEEGACVVEKMVRLEIGVEGVKTRSLEDFGRVRKNVQRVNREFGVHRKIGFGRESVEVL